MLRQNKSFPGLKMNLFGGQYHCGLMKIDLWIMISKPKANSQTNGFRAETPLFRWQWNLKMLTHAKIEINWTSSWKVIAQKFQFSLFEKITLHSCLLTRKMKFTRILTYFSFLVKKIVFKHHFCKLFRDWALVKRKSPNTVRVSGIEVLVLFQCDSRKRLYRAKVLKSRRETVIMMQLIQTLAL